MLVYCCVREHSSHGTNELSLGCQKENFIGSMGVAFQRTPLAAAYALNVLYIYS